MLEQRQPNMRACECISSVPSAMGKGSRAIDEDGQQQERTDRGAFLLLVKAGMCHACNLALGGLFIRPCMPPYLAAQQQGISPASYAKVSCWTRLHAHYGDWQASR